METTYRLEELAEQAAVSPRTVRYYVQRGLLPAPVFRGKDSAYGPEHLVRLKAIKRLQEQFLPLDAIQEAFAGRTPAEIDRLGEGAVPAPPPAPTPMARAPSTEGQRWTRYVLLPGLEVQVAEDATEEVREMVARWRAEAQNKPVRPGGR